MQCHVQTIWYYSTACSVLWCWCMGNGQLWGNWENPVSVLQIYNTSAHKSTHSCSNGRTGMIPCTTTHPAKSNHILCPLYEFMYIRTKRYYILLRTEWLHPLYCYPQSAFDLACNVLGNGSGRYRNMKLGMGSILISRAHNNYIMAVFKLL